MEGAEIMDAEARNIYPPKDSFEVWKTLSNEISKKHLVSHKPTDSTFPSIENCTGNRALEKHLQYNLGTKVASGQRESEFTSRNSTLENAFCDNEIST